MSVRKCVAELFLQVFERVARAIGYAAALLDGEVQAARRAYRAVAA
jgi:hypothetical protein